MVGLHRHCLHQGSSCFKQFYRNDSIGVINQSLQASDEFVQLCTFLSLQLKSNWKRISPRFATMFGVISSPNWRYIARNENIHADISTLLCHHEIFKTTEKTSTVPVFFIKISKQSQTKSYLCIKLTRWMKTFGQSILITFPQSVNIDRY